MKSERYGVPSAFASLLAQERDTPSCLATAAILMPTVTLRRVPQREQTAHKCAVA
jgi:hypothetical protein